jgi:hypothetical protein
VREVVGRVTTVRSIVVLIAVALVGGNLQAQTKQVAPVQSASQKQFFPVKQMALTERQVLSFLAATEDIHRVTDNAPEDIDKLSPETVAKLDDVSRKHGLGSYDEYKRIGENVGLVSAGLDEVTNKYVGREALIRLCIARVKADKTLSAESRKEQLQDLNGDLQFALPAVQFKDNISLVAKYSDRLSAVLRGD